jgi:hypothetical protein
MNMGVERWHQHELVWQNAAHRGPRFDGGQAPEKPGLPMLLFPESLGEFPFGSGNLRVLIRELASVPYQRTIDKVRAL